MLIDCDTCVAPADACQGCVMTVLLAGRQAAAPATIRNATRAATGRDRVELDDAERAAIGTLAQAGLVPPLRLVRPA